MKNVNKYVDCKQKCQYPISCQILKGRKMPIGYCHVPKRVDKSRMFRAADSRMSIEYQILVYSKKVFFFSIFLSYMASACSRQSMQGNIALFFKKLMQYFLQYFVILKRLVSEIMKLLSLEIEKKLLPHLKLPSIRNY